MIGIMADSHGKPESIEAAIELFKKRKCGRIYHLGDVCDSVHPETARACIQPLKINNVVTIKGNNDHAIVANHRGQKHSALIETLLDYLENLPLLIDYQHALFAHSLPFNRDLGPSCMIRALTQPYVYRFFREFPQRILFRGHSHAPEIISYRGSSIEMRTPSAGEHIILTANLPCIITCGALTRGLFMLWSPEGSYVECLSIN